jgi:hypothetical protein
VYLTQWTPENILKDSFDFSFAVDNSNPRMREGFYLIHHHVTLAVYSVKGKAIPGEALGALRG